MQQTIGVSLVGHKENIAGVLGRCRIFLDLLENSGRAWPGIKTKTNRMCAKLLLDPF